MNRIMRFFVGLLLGLFILALVMTPVSLGDGPLVLIMAPLFFDAFQAKMCLGKMDEKARVYGQPERPHRIVSRVVPVFTPIQDLTRMPQVARREELLDACLQDVKNDEHLGLLHVRDDTVPLVSQNVVDDTRAAVIEI